MKNNNDLIELHQTQAALDEMQRNNNDLLLILHQTQAALDYNYKLRVTFEKNSDKMDEYGAVARIKNQLSYRLGSVLIEKSKSLSGILSLPFSLVVVYIEYRGFNRFVNDAKLPSVKMYADWREAENTKRHLSFLLGENILKTLQRPSGIIRLPYVIYKTHKTYENTKKG